MMEENREQERKEQQGPGADGRDDDALKGSAGEYVELRTSLAERIFGLGTVACYTGDNTHPQLFLEHIKHAKEIKNYILHASEDARRKRRTLNTLNINADDIDDMD